MLGDTLTHKIVFSPHMDDAALSCGDHIKDWLDKSQKVTIVTVFTHFEKEYFSEDALQYVKNSGFKNIKDFDVGRKKEDTLAMQKLHCKSLHLNFPDAGFRHKGKRAIYPHFSSIFSGKISAYDQSLEKKIEKELQKFIVKNTYYYVPYGIGSHVDHLLLKKIAEKIFPRNQICYYLDFPYALDISAWWKVGGKKVWELVKIKKSIKWTSKFKKSLLRCYSSQMPLLFKKKNLFYPEVLFAGRS